MICQEWRLVEAENPIIKAALDTLNYQDKMDYQAKLMDMLIRSYFIFKKDGTYEILMMGKEQPSFGKWEISPDGKKLYTTNQAGKKLTILLEEITEDTLILRMDSNGNVNRLILAPKM